MHRRPYAVLIEQRAAITAPSAAISTGERQKTDGSGLLGASIRR